MNGNGADGLASALSLTTAVRFKVGVLRFIRLSRGKEEDVFNTTKTIDKCAR